MDFESALWIKKEKCIRCGSCAAACPEKALRMSDKGAVIDRSRCNFCAGQTEPLCLETCPTMAIAHVDRDVSSTELVKELTADRIFFNINGPSGERGGVTLSGGEPLAQSDFAFELLEGLKNTGIHTCIETSLFAPAEVIQRLPGLVDYLICDIKFFDEAEHQKYTGVSNAEILANFKYLAKRISDILVRVPMIPGINATEDNLRAIRGFVDSQKNDIRIEPLNFNWFSSSKYGTLGLPYFNPDARAFGSEDIARFNELVSVRG
jgi:pyruvate formate lyase activating enzyme